MSADDAAFSKTWWDDKYAASDRVWSGRPNERLVEHASDLAPGVALDVGCGEGADVVWLAERGWRVTGFDLSDVALERARRHAGEAGVADRTSWQQGDLEAGAELSGGADLVSAQYLHLPAACFARAYAAVAGAVRHGGTLLVVGHHPADAHLRNPALRELLFAPEQVTALLDGGWRIDVAEALTREVSGADGEPLTVTDTVVVACRDEA